MTKTVDDNRGRKKGKKGYELPDRILLFLYEMQKEYGLEKLSNRIETEKIRELPHEFFGRWLGKILDHPRVDKRLGRLDNTDPPK
ncbi:MAG: hypothetical protein ACOCZJ_02460, partial [Thermoplasmatota archaeon]